MLNRKSPDIEIPEELQILFLANYYKIVKAVNITVNKTVFYVTNSMQFYVINCNYIMIILLYVT